MNVEWAKKQWEIGVIEPEYIEFLKITYLNRALEGADVQSANMLAAYAGFLNNEKIDSDTYPLYLDVLDSNNATAVDVLLEGYEPADFLNCVVPNFYIVQSLFQLLNHHKRNEIYRKTLEVVVGYFTVVYHSPEEGYQLYKLSVEEVNSVGKLLDESKDQDDPLNRIILDLLYYLSQLERPHETDQKKLGVARQAALMRSYFFDNSHSLREALTEVVLEEVENPTYGVRPDHVYGRRPS